MEERVKKVEKLKPSRPVILPRVQLVGDTRISSALGARSQERTLLKEDVIRSMRGSGATTFQDSETRPSPIRLPAFTGTVQDIQAVDKTAASLVDTGKNTTWIPANLKRFLVVGLVSLFVIHLTGK